MAADPAARLPRHHLRPLSPCPHLIDPLDLDHWIGRLYRVAQAFDAALRLGLQRQQIGVLLGLLGCEATVMALVVLESLAESARCRGEVP